LLRKSSDTAIQIMPPLTDEVVASLHAGDRVAISGVIYVARDAAHKRMVEALQKGQPLPFDPQGQIIYYMGPSPTRPGKAFGSAGPTTAGRMDPYTPMLLAAGLKGMIGKGSRGLPVREAMQKHKAVYFAALGGVAALVAKAIRSASVVAFEDLGPEAVLRLEVENLPAIVVNDMYSGDAYEAGQAKYRR
jgi:fumarate hydratase subunit beta